MQPPAVPLWVRSYWPPTVKNLPIARVHPMPDLVRVRFAAPTGVYPHYTKVRNMSTATLDTTAPATTPADTTTPAEAPTTPTTPAVPAPTKQEILDAKRKVVRLEKAAAKAAKHEATLAQRADGIIGTLYGALATPHGTTKKEILDVLVVKFPARDRDGMLVTVGIQLSRLAKPNAKHPGTFAETGRPVINYKDATRGRVYGFADVLTVPEVQVVATPEVVAPAPAPEPEVAEPITPVAELAPEPTTPEVVAPAPAQGRRARGR